MSLCWACLGNLPFLIKWFWSNRYSDLLPKSSLQDLSRQDTYTLINFEACVVYNWWGRWKRAKSWAVLGYAWYPHSCSSASDNISLLNYAVYIFFKIKKYCFFNLFIFNWRMTALQCCVVFCHTTMRIRQGYTCGPSVLKLPQLPPHPTPLGRLKA